MQRKYITYIYDLFLELSYSILSGPLFFSLTRVTRLNRPKDPYRPHIVGHRLLEILMCGTIDARLFPVNPPEPRSLPPRQVNPI